MNVKAFIDSGILEMYCMGLATQDECVLIEKLADQHEEIKTEIEKVAEASKGYGRSGDGHHIFKPHVWEAIEKAIQMPPLLTEQIDPQFWLEFIKPYAYLLDDEIPLQQIDLPGDRLRSTYIAKAFNGQGLEEIHENNNECLLMIQGECSITFNGKTKIYRTGDLIVIPKNTHHSAWSLSDDMMLIGQLIAA